MSDQAEQVEPAEEIDAREAMNFLRDMAFQMTDHLIKINDDVPHDRMTEFSNSLARMSMALGELNTTLDQFIEAHAGEVEAGVEMASEEEEADEDAEGDEEDEEEAE
jgi:hypothetical protein